MQVDRIGRSLHTSDGCSVDPSAERSPVFRGTAVASRRTLPEKRREGWTKGALWAPVLGALLLLCAGCAAAEPRTGTRSVGLDGAKSIEAEVDLGSGDLEVSGVADGAMNGSFTYDTPEERPEVGYAVGREEVGRLTVRQPGSKGGFRLRDARDEWNLELNDAVPLALRLESGSGDSRLDSKDLNLTALDLASGSGDVAADLSADHPDLASVSARVGSGSLDLDLSGDHPSLTELGAKTGSGDAVVDLTGGWRGGLAARISAGSGDVTVRLPADVGVRAVAASGSGDVDAGGLRRDGDAYVNEAYEKPQTTLRLDVSTGSGDVALESSR